MKGVFKIIFKCMKEIQRRLFHFREPKRTACTTFSPGASKFKVFLVTSMNDSYVKSFTVYAVLQKGQAIDFLEAS